MAGQMLDLDWGLLFLSIEYDKFLIDLQFVVRVNSIFNLLSNHSNQVLSFRVLSGFFGFSGRVTSGSGFFGFGFGSGRVGILNPIENSIWNNTLHFMKSTVRYV